MLVFLFFFLKNVTIKDKSTILGQWSPPTAGMIRILFAKMKICFYDKVAKVFTFFVSCINDKKLGFSLLTIHYDMSSVFTSHY